MSPPDTLAAELERLVRREQHAKRLPSVAAAVVRDGETVWETAVGAADTVSGTDATPDTQYRIGSITKTFTAAAIMQLRDLGSLELEDTLDRHIDGAAHRPTLRRLLSHTSGIQRETQDDAWLSLRFASAQELVETLGDAEQVLPPGARFHYSNLAFALLGVVVERASGMPYADYVRTRLLDPLGLGRIGFEPEPPAATGYLVQEYVEGAVVEAAVETGGWISAGQMWGTVRDLCRWAAFLAEPDESVWRDRRSRRCDGADDRRPRSLDRRLRARPRPPARRRADPRRPRRAMPGFIAGVLISPEDKVGAAVLTNSSAAAVENSCSTLVARTVDAWPVSPGRGASRSRRRPTSSRCSASGGSRPARSSSAGATEARGPLHPYPGLETVLRVRRARPTTGGAPSPGRSTARRCGSSATTPEPWSVSSGPATRSRARRAASPRGAATRTAALRARSGGPRGEPGRSPRAGRR